MGKSSQCCRLFKAAGLLGDAGAAGVDSRLVDCELAQRLFERFESTGRGRGDGEVAREAPHRIAREHGVLADGGELAVGLPSPALCSQKSNNRRRV